MALAGCGTFGRVPMTISTLRLSSVACPAGSCVWSPFQDAEANLLFVNRPIAHLGFVGLLSISVRYMMGGVVGKHHCGVSSLFEIVTVSLNRGHRSIFRDCV